ncbi:hypothetical protein GCM10010123_18860 [Pilimelia anulata]|uniref:Uncharacterized protein n=1 Tax=Pilimelia anulata TaxID=53371 RepID=A0A8J3B332_9ACTN|nr:divalent cation tolerance protein CutA [Pilimelia anulata]GGJ89436.1 hypothetical protein GCM10010123_18860 [Pilimelia anulata]
MTEEPACCRVRAAVGDPDRAAALARDAVAAGLAAAVRVGGPVATTYRDGDAIRVAREWEWVADTTEEAYPRLVAYVRTAQPDAAIVVTPILTGDPEYLARVEAGTVRPL